MNGSTNLPPQTPSPDNEIDLLALLIKGCKAIGRGMAAAVKGIGKATLACFNFCIRHFFWLLGGAVSGLLLIFLKGQLTEQEYLTGEAMLVCPGTSLQNIETEINKLNQIVRAQNTMFLASENMLDIKVSLAQSLKSIKFGFGMNLDDNPNVDFVEYDKAKAKDIYIEKTLKGGTNGDHIAKTPVQTKINGCFFLKITTAMDTPSDFQTLGHAVCNYLNRLPELQRQLHLKRLEWENRIAEIEKQKALLDSMLQIEYFEISRIKASSFAQGADKLVLADHQKSGSPIDYNDILNLASEQAQLETLLANTQQVVTIQSDFLPVPTSFRGQKASFGLTWMGLFIVAALLYDNRKALGAYIRRQRQK